MIQGVQNIIMDLGGVLLDIDYHRSIVAFETLGIPTFHQEFSQALQATFFEDFEKGSISESEFYDYIRTLSSQPLTDASIMNAWNAMLLHFPLRRLQILQQLQLHYNTFLCSNTNIIHEKAFNQLLKSACGFETLAVFFDKVYFSHRIGMRKPNEDIFLKIIEDNELQPEKTLFIDDSIQHIQTAQKLGIQTIHLSNDMTIENDIFKPKNA